MGRAAVQETPKPSGAEGYEAACRSVATNGETERMWRRRESNEQEPLPNPLTNQQLAAFKLDLSAHCQHFQDADWLNLSAIDSRLANFILHWASLPGPTISLMEALYFHEDSDKSSPADAPILRSRLRDLQLELGEVLRSWPRLSASSIPVLDEALRQLQLASRKV